jgi:hypothetical protein
MKTKIHQMGYMPLEAFSWNHPFLGNSVKMSQPICDALRAKINRFPKDTIESPIFGQFYEQNCSKS